MLPRANRLRDSKEFRRVSRSGRKFRTNYFVISATGNNSNTSKFGFSVPKRVGNAVVRNLVKRRLRSICLDLVSTTSSLDVVIRAERPIVDISFDRLRVELIEGMKTLEAKIR